MNELLRESVAKAIWSKGDEPAPWSSLHDEEKEYWRAMADAAIGEIRDRVVMPEYKRWRDAEAIDGIPGLAAAANIAAVLVTGKVWPDAVADPALGATMAAAPELLAAIKLAEIWLCNCIPVGRPTDEWPLPMMRAAIAKAEGSDPR